jgi:hypothetical protein
MDREARAGHRSCGRSVVELYNEVRPHSSLGSLTPAALAAKIKELSVVRRNRAGHNPWTLTMHSLDAYKMVPALLSFFPVALEREFPT